MNQPTEKQEAPRVTQSVSASVPERLPENDAFLYFPIWWSQKIDTFFMKNRKGHDRN